jgi:hypothetical membrane protein
MKQVIDNAAPTSGARMRRVLGRVSLAGPILFTTAWLIAWTLQDAYNPRQEDVSALAAMDAQLPGVMIAGFLALGIGILALGVGLLRTVDGGRWARTASILVMIAGLGIIIAGLSRNDCSSELPDCRMLVDAGQVSWHHQLHDGISALVFIALAAAQLVAARAFRRDAAWRDLRLYSIVSGIATFALLVLFASEVVENSNGLVQRVFIAVPLVWIGVLGVRLIRLGDGPTGRLAEPG